MTKNEGHAVYLNGLAVSMPPDASTYDRHEGDEGEDDIIDKLTLRQKLRVAAEFLPELFAWMLEPVNTEQCGRRLKVVAFLLWRDHLFSGIKTLEDLAIHESKCKTTINALAIKFRDRFGFKVLGMRSDEGRAAMRASYAARMAEQSE